MRVSPARCEQRALPASEIPPAPPVDDYSILAEQSKEVAPEGGAGSFFHSLAGGWADISVTDDDETDKIPYPLFLFAKHKKQPLENYPALLAKRPRRGLFVCQGRKTAESQPNYGRISVAIQK